MKNKILSIENKTKNAYINDSNIKELDKGIEEEIKSDIDSIFDFDENKYKLALELANQSYPVFTKKNLDENIERYSKNIEFKSRMSLMRKNKNFSIDELNHMIKVPREEFIINQYLQFMDAWRKKKLDELYKKMKLIAEMSKNIKSISGVFGRFWDLSYSDLYHMDMSFNEKMRHLMENRQFIKKIAELLGRAASSFTEYEEYLIRELKYVPSNYKKTYSPENMVGITLGNSIPDLLPMSLSLLKSKNGSKLFKLQFHEKKLLQYRKNAKLLDEVEETRKERKFKENSKGPFVIVIDTSGSMHGEPEIIAKAMALAFLHIANKGNRKCYIINFSTSIIEFDASNLSKSWNELYRFLSSSFGGGTDIQPAISSAVKKVSDNKWSNSDVIIISDLIINSMGKELEKSVADLKERKVRFHSLTIGSSYHELNTKFLDNNWVYDGSQASINKIIQDLDKYNK